MKLAQLTSFLVFLCLLNVAWSCQEDVKSIVMQGEWSSTNQLQLKVFLNHQSQCKRKKRFLPAVFWFLTLVFASTTITITAIAGGAGDSQPPPKKPKMDDENNNNDEGGPLPPLFHWDEWFAAFGSTLHVLPEFFKLKVLRYNATHYQKFYLLNPDYHVNYGYIEDVRPDFAHNNYQQNVEDSIRMGRDLNEYIQEYARENYQIRVIARRANRRLVRVQRQRSTNVADQVRAIVNDYYFNIEPRLQRRRVLERRALNLRRRLFCTLQGVYLTEGMNNHLGSHRARNLPFTVAIQLQDVVYPHERQWLNEMTAFYGRMEPTPNNGQEEEPQQNNDYDGSERFEEEVPHADVNLPDDAFTNYNDFLHVNLDQPFFTLVQPAKLFYLAALASIARILRGQYNRPNVKKRDVEEADKILHLQFCKYTFDTADFFNHLMSA